MASEQQITANRRNARKSTGPRSLAGKRRAGNNAYRHGLAAKIQTSDRFANEVDRLARKIAGGRDSPIALAYARSAAEASLDLARVRAMKVALIECLTAFGALDPRPEFKPLEIAWLYLKAAGLPTHGIRAPKPIDPAVPLPSQEPERSAEALRRALPELVKLDRYEGRALSRRDRAIQQLNNLRLLNKTNLAKRTQYCLAFSKA
jgi:hypothetical protein